LSRSPVSVVFRFRVTDAVAHRYFRCEVTMMTAHTPEEHDECACMCAMSHPRNVARAHMSEASHQEPRAARDADGLRSSSGMCFYKKQTFTVKADAPMVKAGRLGLVDSACGPTDCAMDTS
jgi:hypothetical protein